MYFHGTSYWRRDLQTPGQLWCPKHEEPLSFAAGADPFLTSPAEYGGKLGKYPGLGDACHSQCSGGAVLRSGYRAL